MASRVRTRDSRTHDFYIPDFYVPDCRVPDGYVTDFYVRRDRTPRRSATSLRLYDRMEAIRVLTAKALIDPWPANKVQDCSAAHGGSYTPKMTVIGTDSGNQQAGPDVDNMDNNVALSFQTQNISGSGRIYFRTWMAQPYW